MGCLSASSDLELRTGRRLRHSYQTQLSGVQNQEEVTFCHCLCGLLPAQDIVNVLFLERYFEFLLVLSENLYAFSHHRLGVEFANSQVEHLQVGNMSFERVLLNPEHRLLRGLPEHSVRQLKPVAQLFLPHLRTHLDEQVVVGVSLPCVTQFSHFSLHGLLARRWLHDWSLLIARVSLNYNSVSLHDCPRLRLHGLLLDEDRVRLQKLLLGA